jgi:dienelactone hydrolase
MDIFGFFPQTLQGCDMLATGGTTPHRVFLPDFFDGQPCPIELYPPTPATKDKLSAWFGAHGDAVAGSERLAALLPHVKRFAGEGVAKWAALGYCWGGRVVALASGGAGTPLVCSAQCHPAALKAEDAARIAIPHLVIISQDESKQDFEKFKAAATGCKRLDTHVFDKMIHGGMAARCDFDDPVALKCYEEGYKIAVGFFDKELK